MIGKKTFDETYDIHDVVQEAESTLFELTQKNMKKDYSALGPIIGRAVEIVEKAHANTGGLTGISTGFYKLDDMTCGWQNSDLVIIAGRPAMGKTAFALSLAKNIAIDQKIPMAFFSLEMTDVQLANRLMANVCEIDGKTLLSGQLDREDWKRLDKNLTFMTEAPLFVDDTEGLSLMGAKSATPASMVGISLLMVSTTLISKQSFPRQMANPPRFKATICWATWRW